MSRNYDHLSREELLGLLQARDKRDATRFGLVWEANEIEREKAINGDFVALDLDPSLSCGEGPWQNLIIEGDNFDALRALNMSFKGQVKCIYIDPPYNTGNKDFVYNDHFVEKEDLWRHSTWCEFMYQRLMLAKDLLREDGAIFVSIDDNEVAALRFLMERIFGPSNFLATLVWEKGKKGDAKFFSVTHEYVHCFAISKQHLLSQGVSFRRKKPGVDDVLLKYQTLVAKLGENHTEIRKEMMAWFNALPATNPAKKHKHYNCSDNRGLYFPADFAGPDDGRESRPRYDIIHPSTGKPCKKPSTGWRWEESRTLQALKENPPRIHFGVDESTIPNRKSYLVEIDSEPFPSVFYRDGRGATLEVESILGKGTFSFPKDSNVLHELLDLVVEDGDLVLDFFAGSGTTAHSVLKANKADGGNRRFILVSSTEATEENPEKNLCRDVCAERVRRVAQGYRNTKGEEIEGLGGDFAYLRCRKIPSGELLEIPHDQVWTALQLIHRPTLSTYQEAPYLVAEGPEGALIYVPSFRKELLPDLRETVARHASVIIYSWQPGLLRQHLKAAHVQHEAIPESLIRRFGLKK